MKPEFAVQSPDGWTHPIPETQTPLRECYTVLGVSCAVWTNSEDILAAARSSFRQVIEPCPSPVLTMRLWVDRAASSQPPWPQPYFRGLSHLVYAGFDHENSLLLDLRRRLIIGRFSPMMAHDQAYWQRVIFPNAVGLASESLGITVLHCACVAREGKGLLLAGGGGAGKSTLSVAMARNGFAFLSDDWTYFSGGGSGLRAWGLATPVKLLPDAVVYFHELQHLQPGISLNGEQAYEVDPELVFGVRRSLCCEPRWLVFLERQERSEYRLARMPARQAAALLEVDLEDLPPELSDTGEKQSQVIAELVQRDCWLLRHGENPQDLARLLARFCSDSVKPVEPPEHPSA